MNVLMSINPQYVEQMITGKKLYEFRKRDFSHQVDYVYIYQTRPIMMITHRFKVETIVIDTPGHIWHRFKNVSGMDKESFFNYYQNHQTAIAIKINDLEHLKQPLRLADINIKQAPQSFRYI